MSKEENILVVRRSLFDQLGSFQGLCLEVDRYLPVLLNRANNFFTPRGPAETNPGWKQIIPYVLFVHGDRVLHYVRGKKGGEQRLVAKGSLGIGGHMNDEDKDPTSLDAVAYDVAVQREVNEELRVGTPYRNRIVALLNDDSNEVGQVHLGIVHIFLCDTDAISQGEKVITELQFLDRAQLDARRDAMETWSQLCYDRLDELLKIARTNL